MTVVSTPLAASKAHFAARIPAFSGRGLRVLRAAPPSLARVRVPGSKSFTNRAAVLAGLCPAPVTLEGVLLSDDSWWVFDSLERLGFRVTLDPARESVRVEPPKDAPPGLVSLYFGMAGTLARFFPAVVLNFAATFPHLGAVRASVSGAPRLCERPLAELVTALRALGARMSAERMPYEMASSTLEGQCFVSGKTSGQFLSGLLLAAAGSRRRVFVERIDSLVQPDYVRMTMGALRDFGAGLEADDELTEFEVYAPAGLRRDTYVVEADASTACYFMAYAALLGTELVIENIGSASLQPDVGFAGFLERMGVGVTVTPGSVHVHPCPGGSRLPGGGGHRLRGGFDADFSAYSDQALTAGVLSLFADAPVRVHGVEHIRGHESDRIASLVANLRDLGVEADEFPDGFRVTPYAYGTNLAGLWETHHDHRFAMTGFLVGLGHPHVEILSPGCVEKTAPDFFARMEALGCSFG